MATKVLRPSELSGGELAELLALVRGSDSAEIKLSVPMDAQRATLRILDVDPLEAQIRQVFFSTLRIWRSTRAALRFGRAGCRDGLETRR